MIRRTLAALVAAVSLVLGVAVAPAHAAVPPAITLGHWSYFQWNGQYVAGRAFYIYDRSGDSTIHAALQQVINDLQYDLNARNAWGIVPAVYYVQDDANVGACGDFGSLAGYSFITLCSGGLGGGTSYTTSDIGGGHYAGNGGNLHPSIHIEREYPDYNTTYSMIAHELLHAYGMRHTDNCADLMGGSEFTPSCRLTVGVLKHPSPADFDAMTNFYGGYGVFAHPWYS